MIIDTAGNIIYEPIQNCDCSITGGCERCNQFWRLGLSELEKNPRPALPVYPETYREGFIGILTDDEAREMREKLSLFKKRFNDDFAKKHQILFGHQNAVLVYEEIKDASLANKITN